MASKKFKSAGVPPRSSSPDEILQAASPLLDALPAATPQPSKAVPAAVEETVQLNVRIRRSLADALADVAADRRTTQKVIICEALKNVGFAVHADDLSDRSGRRRRGSRS